MAIHRFQDTRPSDRPALALLPRRLVVGTVCLAAMGTALGCASQATQEVAASPPGDLAPAVGSIACRVTAPARVLSSKVYVPGGVSARIEGGHAEVLFETTKSHCALVDLESLEASVASSGTCATSRRLVLRTSSGDPRLAWEPIQRAEVGSSAAAVSDAPPPFATALLAPRSSAVHAPLLAPGEGAAARSPTLTQMGDDAFLLQWLEGDSTNGYALRVRPVSASGTPLGPILDVAAADAGVIGGSSAAFSDDGTGFVAYIASTTETFDVLAAPAVLPVPVRA